ncbi:MAG: cysteine--tRNA ligase [Hydrococcus sp. RU_2_2]|nr:cysteine--tRNA ligase [Hydrococcus sp. RU_2_2]NJP19791.1 cysteine--tRNA ligase [Hydrococcus sp. CRU_1_1]
MALKIYNTLTRRLEPFIPLEPGKVKMYCCGVTVYDYCHLGHARSYIVWDVVRRYLQWRGDRVTYVQNFTDIDDKILNRAKQEGTSMQEISDRYIQAYFEDIRRLNVKDANEYPRVTEHIAEIHQLIRELEEKGYAYAVDGDVYYQVQQFPSYGKLSGRKQEQMQAGASGRVTDSNFAKKQESLDFVLWKAAKPDEPAWESPWGKGRPGWHIECSAMVRALLGDTIDIHGGGGDLVFPHHENEIAQSEAVTGKPLARYWMHNGMVTVNGEKMSKSLGNFTTIRELLARPVEPMVLRLFVLQAHYRKPLDFTEEAIASATNSWDTLKQGLLFGDRYGKQLGWEQSHRDRRWSRIVSQFQAAMDEDFNTSKGLAILFELAKELRRQANLFIHQGKTDVNAEAIQEQWHTLVHLAQVLGLEAKPEAETPTSLSGFTPVEIEEMICQREAARREKDFAKADCLRKQLQAAGITVIDRPLR